MAHTPEARLEVFKRDRGICQSDECIGVGLEGSPRQFYPTNEVHWDNPVENGYWNLQASHLNRKDYEGSDPLVYNVDGSKRSVMHCTLDHSLHEVRRFGLKGYRHAMLILTGQTLRTYDWIEENGYEDQDLPLDLEIFSPKEIVNINNIRRARLKTLIRRQTGLLLAEQSIFYSIKEMV